jgi:hypothetical protein
MANRRTFQSTRVPVVVGAGLAFVLIVGALVSQALKGSKPADRATRAVIVPTGDRARTVVVPPCGTGAQVTGGAGADQMRNLGATAIQLPRAPGVRVVVVPRCVAGSTTSSTTPSAAFVLRAGARVATGGPPSGPGASQLSQLILPTGSRASVLIVPQCTRPASPPGGRQVVLAPRPSHPGTAIAPPC